MKLSSYFSSKNKQKTKDNNNSNSKNSNNNANNNNDYVVEIIENERKGLMGWSHANLMPEDPRHFVSTAGTSMTFPKSSLEDGWEFMPNTEWIIDNEEGCDDEGWFYAATFEELDNDIIRLPQAKKSVVRRKVWIREVQKIQIKQKVTKTAKQRAIEEIQYGIEHSDLYDRDEYNDSDNNGDLVDLAADGIDNYELASDDGKEEEEDEDFTGFLRRGIFGTLLGQSNSKDQGVAQDSILRIKNDQELSATARKIMTLEEECKKDEEIWLKEWTRNRKAILKFDIKELEAHCTKFSKRVDKEAHLGLEHVNMLESEINRTKVELEKKKREYFFPLNHLVVGDSGIYAGLDDIILDHMTGNFSLKINPSKESPSICILITGKDSIESGISINLKVEGFQLKGDKGKGIPRLRLESIGLNIVLRIDITVNFNVKKNTWETSPEKFRVQILSFKGPLGTSKLLVGATLKLLTPIIRYQILNALPHELGDLIKSLPSPVNILGEFSVVGTELKHFSNDLKKSTFVCKACGYSSQQIDMFQWLQYSLDRSKIMKNMTDVLAYRRLSIRHPEKWEKILKLWDEAAKIYCSKVIRLSHESNNERNNHLSPSEMTITFQSIVAVADELSRKKLITNFNLKHLDGQASVNQLLRFGFKFLNRVTKEAALKSSGIKHARIMLMLERIKKNYELGLEGIKIVSRNLDFAQLKLACGIHAGPEGHVDMTVANIYAQAPVNLNTFMSKDKNLGGQSALVPIRLSVKPQETGEIIIEVQFVPKNPGGSPKRDSKKRFSVDNSPDNRRNSDDNTSNRRKSDSFHSNNGLPHIPSITEINAKSILKIAAMAPHFSIILDKHSQFKQGAELFTMALGPREEGTSLAKEKRKSIGTPDDKDNDFEKGCPILVKTAPNVKFLAQIPKAHVGINLPNLIAFAKAHFVDVVALKDFLELSLGGEFYEDQLMIGQVVIDRVSKYLLNVGVDIDVNINGKVIALDNEIMIRIETSHDDTINPNNILKKEVKPKEENSAINLRAAVYLMDLIEDGIEIDKVVKEAMGINDNEKKN